MSFCLSLLLWAAPLYAAPTPDTPASDTPDAPDAPASDAPDTPAPAAPAPDLVHPTTWTGRRVIASQLFADDGGLPDDDLNPLLLVHDDVLYNPQDVRQDINTLYRVGSFARVEVEIREDLQSDAQGNPIEGSSDGIYVIYHVYPPPRLESIQIAGDRKISRARILQLIGRKRGDQFFHEEADGIGARIEQYYRDSGWVRAKVTASASSTDSSGQQAVLSINIDEGEPQRIGEIRVQRQEALSAVLLQGLLWRHSLISGRPLEDASLRAFSEDVKERLLKGGWFDGRVRLTPILKGSTTDLVLVIDPGRRYRVQRERGSGLPRRQEVIEALHLKEGALIARSFEEDSSSILTRRLADRGYLDAIVDVRIEQPGAEARAPDRGETLIVVEGERGPGFRLGATDFTGDEERTPAFLRGALRQAGPLSLQRGFYTQGGVAEGLSVLEEYYRSQGFLEAGLSAAPATRRKPRFNLLHGMVVPMDIGITIAPGVRTLLGDITAVGAALPVEDLFTPLREQPLNPAGLDVLCQQIIRLHQESGYLYADAYPVLSLSPDGSVATVRIEIEPGPRVLLRSVLIQGNHRTRRELIAREVDMSAGTPISPSALARIRRRLYDLDVFSRVDVEPVGDADRVKDLLITVEERPNLYLELGGSAATDQGIQAFGRGGVRNLFGYGHRLTLLGQVGLGWSGDTWSLDLLQPEWRAAARYEAPDLPTRGELLLLDVIFNAEDQERFYRLGSSGIGLGIRLSLGGSSSAELSWKLQLRRLLDADPALIIEGDPWLDLFDGESPTFPTPARATSGPALSVLLDFRDDAFNPRSGAAASLEVRVSDGLASRLSADLPDEASWVRSEGGVTAWLPLGPDAGNPGLVFRLRGGVAAVGRSGTLPVEERFRLGGGSSVRGFEPDSIGPANLASSADLNLPDAIAPIVDWASRNNARWIPTGGDTMLLTGVELKLPFTSLGLRGWDTWQLALFADAGNTWFRKEGITTDSMQTQDDPFLRYSVGFGIRRSTVVGPIQLDLGFNPSPITERGETAAITGFIPMQLHISLGAL